MEFKIGDRVHVKPEYLDMVKIGNDMDGNEGIWQLGSHNVLTVFRIDLELDTAFPIELQWGVNEDGKIITISVGENEIVKAAPVTSPAEDIKGAEKLFVKDDNTDEVLLTLYPSEEPLGFSTVSDNEMYVETFEEDLVNHPSHYTSGKIETIEIIEEITQHYDDGFVSYCVGNALKYLSRAPHKHEDPGEDLSKAMKYLEFAVNHIEENKM